MLLKCLQLSQVWSEISDLLWLPSCATKVEWLQTDGFQVLGLCFQFHDFWHKSAQGSMVFWGTLASFYGEPHSVSKTNSKRPWDGKLRDQVWAVLHCVNQLWRDVAGWTVSHQLLPITGTIQCLKHCAETRLSSPKVHKDRSVGLQLCINCAALTVSKKRLFHYWYWWKIKWCLCDRCEQDCICKPKKKMQTRKLSCFLWSSYIPASMCIATTSGNKSVFVWNKWLFSSF